MEPQRQPSKSDLAEAVDQGVQEENSSENDATEKTENKPEESSPENNKPLKGFNVDDPLGLLQSKHIAAAAADASNACNNDKARKRKYKSEDERLEANRKSAAESRLRKKILMEKLQETIGVLQDENTRLKLENDMLKGQMNMGTNHMLPFNSTVNSALLTSRDPSTSLLGDNNRLNGGNVNSFLNNGGLAQTNLPYPGNGNQISQQLFDNSQVENRRNIVAVSLLIFFPSLLSFGL